MSTADDWTPDPQRSFDEHDPSLEPYASMSRDEVWELMQAEPDLRRWEFLNEYLLDKMTGRELRCNTFAKKLGMWIMDEYGTHGIDQAVFVARLAGEMARRIFDEMPARGPAEECN